MTRAIAALIGIMTDAGAPLRCRIEACAALLAYEAPPEAVALAKTFLIWVFENPEEHASDKLDALRLMQKAEARRISQPTVAAGDEHRDRELRRKIAMGHRRAKLMTEGLWPAPKGWADDLEG